MAGTGIGGWGRTRMVVATTRTGSSASAASAVRTRWFSESWAVLGATRTSGARPGGSSTSGWGTSKGIGPVTWTPAGQRALNIGLEHGRRDLNGQRERLD